MIDTFTEIKEDIKSEPSETIIELTNEPEAVDTETSAEFQMTVPDFVQETFSSRKSRSVAPKVYRNFEHEWNELVSDIVDLLF